MPENRSFRKDLLKGIDDIDVLKDVLNAIYNDAVQGTVTNKPVIQMLIHACDYLQSNVRILKDRLVS